MSRFSSPAVALIVILCASVSLSRADEQAQAKLDEAIELQLEAKTPADLKQVVALCEEAIKGGLDEANEKFAKELVASTLFDFSKQVAQVLISRPAVNNAEWQKLHKDAMRDLEKAIEFGAQSGEANLLLARLAAFPGGDENKAREAATRAVDALKEDKETLAEALVIRAGLRKDGEKRLADLNAALEANPASPQALQLRGLHYISEKKFEEAIQDLTQVLEKNANNLTALQTLTQALMQLGKFEEAEAQITKLIEGNPKSPLGYRMRAALHAQQKQFDKAVKDLSQALEIEPNDVGARLARAQIYQQQEDYKNARRDVDDALDLRPGLVAAVELRVQIAAAQGRYQAAIDDLNDLIQHAPNNDQYRLQLGLLYSEDKRPRKAIEEYTKVLQRQAENWRILQLRGNTLLNIGDHKKAVADFEAALERAPDDDGLLNNLAWVLATSPEENVRDGKRAVELGRRACEVTEFKEAHILSTFAAAFAEVGDFENAKKWSAKAVALEEKEIEAEENAELREALTEQLQQLKSELESYQQEKPWRERQEIKENPDPIESTGNSLDT